VFVLNELSWWRAMPIGLSCLLHAGLVAGLVLTQPWMTGMGAPQPPVLPVQLVTLEAAEPPREPAVCRRLAGPRRRPPVETASFRSGRMSLPSVYQLMYTLMYTRPFARTGRGGHPARHRRARASAGLAGAPREQQHGRASAVGSPRGREARGGAVGLDAKTVVQPVRFPKAR
jgi:hypothetical protein